MIQLILADSNSARHNTLSELLRELGYTVTDADDGVPLTALLEAQDFDMLLIETDLPHTDYARLLRRETRSKILGNTPVVIIAEQSLEKVEDYLEMGADDFVVAPFRPTLMKSRLETVLGTRWLENTGSARIQDYLELADDLLRYVLPVGFDLSHALDRPVLMELVVRAAQQLSMADGATFYVPEDEHLWFTVMRTESLQLVLGGKSGNTIPFDPLPIYNPETGEPNHRNIATHVALTGESINIADVYHNDKFDFSATKEFDARNHYRTVSCLAVPLKDHKEDIIGVLQLLNAHDDKGNIIPFKHHDVTAIQSLGTQAAIAMNNMLLLEEQAKLIKFETDIQVGRTVQASFLPKKLPDPDGWQIAAQFHPAREVAGDFYDVFEIQDDVIALVIADVCDKGVPAAMYMALTCSLLRAFSNQSYTLDSEATHTKVETRETPSVDSTSPLIEGLRRTNEYLIAYHAELNMFATMFFGLLHTKTGMLSYINCGHNPPAVIGPDGIKEFLKPTGPVVGFLQNAPFKMESTELQPGDVLMTFTDGVPESRSEDATFFSDKRLNELLESEPIQDVEVLLKRVLTELQGHMGDAPQYDDITMLAVLHRKG